MALDTGLSDMEKKTFVGYPFFLYDMCPPCLLGHSVHPNACATRKKSYTPSPPPPQH